MRYPVTRFNPGKKQRGQMGIIGVILGLVIIGLGLYFVIGHFLSAKDNEASQNGTSDFVTMIGNVQQTYHNISAGYTGVTAQTLITNGDVPSELVNGTTIISPFGATPVTVAPATLYSAGDAISFTVQVPPANCANFANTLSSNVAKMTVGGTTIVDTTAGTSLNPTTLGTACSGGGGAQIPVVLTATR